jgi:hypothetical protein
VCVKGLYYGAMCVCVCMYHGHGHGHGHFIKTLELQECASCPPQYPGYYADVCMCMYVCVWGHFYGAICVYVCMHACMCVYVYRDDTTVRYVCVCCVCMCVGRIPRYVCVCMYACMHVCVCVCVKGRYYGAIYAHVCMYVCMHALPMQGLNRFLCTSL